MAVLFLLGFTLLQDLAQGFAHVTPWFIISYAASSIGQVLATTCQNQPGTHTCTTAGPGGMPFTMTVTNPTVVQGLEIMIAYFVVTTILGLILFKREEFS